MKAQDVWTGLPRRAQAGLVGGVLLILLAAGAAAWWLLRVDYQPLFTDLKPQDAQAMTTELDRLKLPYRLGDEGTSILVGSDAVHATRLKLMGKELPLHGAVGLELFNKTDFGMTEFAQKINYQRALQGELTRTIQSLAEVREVRVLLALPEQGLFKQPSIRAKASITLDLRAGKALRAEQVGGIQRLVAAAVPGMSTADVTIVDGHGIALTRADNAGGGNPAEPEAGAPGARLDLKRDTETYLSRKAGAVLDSAFGPGQALASVDVTLNMDQIRTTTEDVLPAAARAGLQPTGVLTRERETLRDAGASADARVADNAGMRSGSAQREVDYAVGRRVEQVVSQPGSIRRIQVVAVVREPLDSAQEEQLRKVLAASVGASPERGDAVVVHSLAKVIAPERDSVARSADGASGDAALAASQPRSAGAWQLPVHQADLVLAGLLALTGLAGLTAYLAWRRRSSEPAALSDAERAAALQRVRDWMAEPDAGSRP